MGNPRLLIDDGERKRPVDRVQRAQTTLPIEHRQELRLLTPSGAPCGDVKPALDGDLERRSTNVECRLAAGVSRQSRRGEILGFRDHEVHLGSC